MSSKRPMEGVVSFLDFSIPTRPLNSTTGLATAAYRVVTPSYFTLIRNPLRGGRLFTEQDGPDAPSVIIVNESFARTFMPGENALGKQIRLRVPADPGHVNLAQIVGIVPIRGNLPGTCTMCFTSQPHQRFSCRCCKIPSPHATRPFS